MKPFVITIARRYGSGGKTVGRMLAKELNIPFYDREIIAMASEDSGVNEVLFSDERLRPDLRSRLRGLYKGEPVLGYSTPAKGAPRDGELFEYQAAVIRRLAETGPCIIMGRCADYVLGQRSDVARVFVHADADFCLEQAMLVNSMSREDVRKKIVQVDEYRAKFYQRHTGRDWYDARNYDLTLNSAVLGFEGVRDAIVQYLEVRSRY